jgi:glycine oxidase
VRVEMATAADVRALEPAATPAARGALYFLDHALVDNARLSAATAQAAARAGATVRTHEEVLSLATAGGRVGGVETAAGRLAADAVVLAAGCWSSRLTPWRPGMLRPSKGEMISLEAAPRPIERMVGMVGATIVPRADGRMMVGATRIDGDPSRHVTAGAVARMLAAAATLVPALAEARFGAAWAGLRPWTPDGAPVIGPDGAVDGLYWATGHAGMGILSAPTTADSLAALLDGRAPPVPLEAFDPGRFATVAAA